MNHAPKFCCNQKFEKSKFEEQLESSLSQDQSPIDLTNTGSLQVSSKQLGKIVDTTSDDPELKNSEEDLQKETPTLHRSN